MRLSFLCLLALLSLLRPDASVAQTVDVEALAKRTQEAYYAQDFRNAIRLAQETLNANKTRPSAKFDTELNQHGILAASSELTRDYAAAERHYRDLLAVLERMFGRDTVNSAFAMEGLARVVLKNGKVAEAEQLYERVAAARKILLLSGIDHFKARHQQNRARIALAKGAWRRAYEGFREAFLTLGRDGPPPAQSTDYLADPLSSEMNAANFLGLARAAWNLSRRQGQDANLVVSETFETIQLKWRTAAADAIMKAAQRRDDTTGATGRQMDREERLKQLRAQQEDNTQAWFAEREKDPMFRDLWAKYMDPNRAMSTESILRSQSEMIELSNKLVEAYGKCPTMAPSCMREAKEIEGKLQALSKQNRGQIGPREDLGKQVHARERQIPGYAEHQKREIALAMEIERLSAEVAARPAANTRAPSRPPPGRFNETDALSVAKVQALLGPNEALVTYLTGDDDAFVWAITRSESQWTPVTLDGEVLPERVEALRCGLDQQAWQDEGRADRCRQLLGVQFTSEDAAAGKPLPFDLGRAYELYDATLGKLAATLQGKRLIVVSSGALANLPLSVLVMEPPAEGMPSSAAAYRTAKWLGTQHAITVLPSVASLNALRASAKPSQAREAFVGWGDPVLKGTADCPPVPASPSACPGEAAAGQTRTGVARSAARRSATRGVVDVESLRAVCPLPDTAYELRCVARSVGASDSSVYVGTWATEVAIKRAPLHLYRVLHFATHGLLAAESGQFASGYAEPALLFTPPDRPTSDDDGLLKASEIAQLKLDADWVVLSACNTAAAGGNETEMLSGLARGFFHAGARAVMVSHWAVESDAAVKLTTRAFSEMRAAPDLGRGEAMRRSMAALVERGAAHEAHPYYWAPFVVVGEGR
jgi:CHAT domain-containing protein